MTISDDTGQGGYLQIGPVRLVGVQTSAEPANETVSDRATIDAVPFEQVRHLCSGKPLGRFPQPHEQR